MKKRFLRKLRRLPRAGLWSLALVAILLLTFRLALPQLLKRYVNRELSRIPDYKAEVGDIDVHLWRGAYSIHSVKLLKRTGQVPVPFFDSPLVDLSVQWRELFRGALVARIRVDRPRVNFVAGRRDVDSQTRVDSRWQDAVTQLFPLRINSFTVHEGELHFRNFHTSPQVDIFLDQVNAVATNLTNSLRISKNRVARIQAQGRAQSQAPFTLNLDLDPFATGPNFSLAGSIENLDATKLNDFFRAYANIDVKSGVFSIYSELNASSMQFHGYVKPIVKDLQVLSLKEDISNPLRMAWKALVAGAAQLFTNPTHDQIATQVNLSGKFDKPDVDYWSTIGYLLYNAFIQALSPSVKSED